MSLLALSVYLRLTDQRMSYPMAEELFPFNPRSPACIVLLSPLSSLGVTWSIDIIGDAVVARSNQFSNSSGLWNAELLVDQFRLVDLVVK